MNYYSITTEDMQHNADAVKEVTILGLLNFGETEISEDLIEKYAMVVVLKRTWVQRIWKKFNFREQEEENMDRIKLVLVKLPKLADESAEASTE